MPPVFRWQIGEKRWQIEKKRKLQLEKSTKGGGRQEMRGQSGNEEEVGCQTRNNANLPHVVLVSCGKTGCLLGSKSEKSEKEGNSRKKREIDGKAVKTSSRGGIYMRFI